MRHGNSVSVYDVQCSLQHDGQTHFEQHIEHHKQQQYCQVPRNISGLFFFGASEGALFVANTLPLFLVRQSTPLLTAKAYLHSLAERLAKLPALHPQRYSADVHSARFPTFRFSMADSAQESLQIAH